MKFIEDAKVGKTKITADGYLVADVRCARTGIQLYAGFEVGKPELESVRVYRPESEVFAKDSLATYAHKPATNDHPMQPVNAKNWKELSVGAIGGDVARDGEYVRVPVMFMDAEAIADIEAGKAELSMGYAMDLVWESGTTKSGEQYDAVQRNLKMNHIALVEKGRAGKECRVGDNATHWGAAPILTTDHEESMTIETRTVTIDGLSVSTTEQGAQAIDKLQKDKQALADSLEEANGKHQSALDAKDKELATKDAEIADLKAKVLDEKALDAKVKVRADLINSALKLAKDADFTGLSDAEIRKAAVKAVRGEDAIAGKSDAYIEAAFDLALADHTDDRVRDKVGDSAHKASDDNGQTDYEQRLNDSWKGGAK